ncbi:MAG: hypothetical protein GC160_04370 [Acidobacteria bacterium]|nr:hypothetical protein [Acidobacteriota bacterium]
MTSCPSASRRRLRAQQGQATVEWLLLIAVVAPMAVLMFEVLRYLARFYAFTSWAISLPFP